MPVYTKWSEEQKREKQKPPYENMIGTSEIGPWFEYFDITTAMLAYFVAFPSWFGAIFIPLHEILTHIFFYFFGKSYPKNVLILDGLVYLFALAKAIIQQRTEGIIIMVAILIVFAIRVVHAILKIRRYSRQKNRVDTTKKNKNQKFKYKKRNTIKTTHVLILIYIILIIVESFFFVPYDRIQVFRSEQNVPHTEIIGSGYSTIFDISDCEAYIFSHEDTGIGKRVNTPQVLINVSITTVFVAAIYFLFVYKKKKPVGVPTSNVMEKQLSLFDDVDICESEADELISCREELTEETKQQILEEMKGAECITVHTLSSKNGYHKYAIERTNENSALIDKWLDKSTGCLYITVMYRDGEAESMLVTKEFFDTLYKHFDT